MQQPEAGQVADRPLDVVSLSELLRSSGDLADKLGDHQQGRMPRKDVDQDDALVADVLSLGGRDILIACPFRAGLAWESTPFLCHAPGCSTSAGALSLS
jgi:hypothetical protein